MAFYSILRSCFLRCALLVVIVRTEEVFNTTPRSIKTNFSCFNRPMGFYADVEANCRVYHTCDDHGNKFSYRCPEETAFRQDALICDHAHLVDCQATVYPSTQPPNENIDKYVDNAHASSSIRSPGGSVGSLDDHRLSFSRSFQVIQRSDKSLPNKLQSGFVFSASLFLKDQDRACDRAGQISDASKMCNPKNRMAVPIARTLPDRFDSWRPRNDKASPKGSPLSFAESRAFVRDSGRSFERPIANSSPMRPPAPNIHQQPPFPRERSSFGYNSDYHSYSETLRSIQTNAKHETSTKPTTEIPVHALTLSLKPLVPNELEYDPYYPKQPTSTEAYYTPSNRGKVDIDARLFSSSQSTSLIARPNVPFKIPSVLPDLNTLDDLVDRRKFFYIPRTEIKSI
ncbi:hypothetical protein DMN91_003856 [Ooceraea biroi]|uniref:Chitin-binding type-2 domain-containing protein n=1 Tax=Ooceraea biroi TaxID=2015173 RepID=A0A026W9E3_OOCBI|nr:uncharacterized protein LOC105282629 [Ooceraea biroi]EZA51624.1 hypothetical protein X777_08808 [Ooceraea biroi]RLU23650.1 hypothetical protein DMN91_003856 [Ooceraea biroi]